MNTYTCECGQTEYSKRALIGHQGSCPECGENQEVAPTSNAEERTIWREFDEFLKPPANRDMKLHLYENCHVLGEHRFVTSDTIPVGHIDICAHCLRAWRGKDA